MTDPGNGKVIGALPDMGVEDVKVAVKHASEAFKSWRKTSEYERAAILNKMFACVFFPSSSSLHGQLTFLFLQHRHREH